jgi:hypothetical protein
VEHIPISWDADEDIRVDPKLPAVWLRRQQTNSTKDSYEFLELLKKHRSKAVGPTVTIGGEGSVREWIELTAFEDKQISAELLEECLETLRNIQSDGPVKMDVRALWFETGQDVLDWIETVKTELKPGEVKQ